MGSEIKAYRIGVDEGEDASYQLYHDNDRQNHCILRNVSCQKGRTRSTVITALFLKQNQSVSNGIGMLVTVN